MTAVRWIVVMLIGGLLPMQVLAQPKGPPTTGKKDNPTGFGVPVPDANVDDVRPWLLGQGKKLNSKDIDPKLLKDLMEKLPKDQKIDQQQIENILNSNEKFQDKNFLKQLEGLSKSEDFPQNLKDKLKDKLP